MEILLYRSSKLDGVFVHRTSDLLSLSPPSSSCQVLFDYLLYQLSPLYYITFLPNPSYLSIVQL
jgi:hypothetical protein